MKKLNKFLANKSTINILIIVLILVVYLCLFFRPKTKELISTWNEASRLKTKIIETERAWANIDSLKERVSKSKKKIEYYEKILPGEKEIPAVLEYLSRAAQKLNVRITGIKPIEQPEEDKERIYYGVAILAKAECGYHQLGRFLNELERADRFMKIADIKIVSDPVETEVHNVHLIIVTYGMKK